ncbi:SGNH/GDSL hydrolase family protein [Rubrivivax rivuli]|uniref:SGNH/GDSL hydrolase family protein n=1 Tax=Rubrivivax rivuli TaxID=1862385 RepID=UPI0013E2E83D|nr:SGNH/GDSL hydrolase family protein [Rubrivivax rivuli]
MNTRRLPALVALASFLAMGAAPALAQSSTGVAVPTPFTAVYVFGDSLSDGGNNNLVFGGLTGPNPTSATFIPSLPYASAPGQRPTYSNGPVWFNSFAAGLGLAGFAQPSLAGGGNYAFGGARTTVDGTGVPPFIPAPFPASLQTQLNSHLATTPVSSTALYVIAGGGNDARATAEAVAANPANIVALTTAGATAYATATAQMVGTLRAAGASNIVVWNTPDLSKSPAALAGGAGAVGAASFITGAYNSALNSALAGSGAQIFDLAGLVGSYVANPGAFGFTNVTQACGFSGNNCDAASALFWDAIHPTAYAQGLLAGAMLSAVPEAGTVWMFMAGLLALGVMVKRRRA